MNDDRMTPTPVRFPADLTARVDAISKSMALSHAAVMRLAINQWFEAGGDKTGPFALAKKSAKKAGKTRRNGDTAY
jgi:predicted DNA-binding protein